MKILKGLMILLVFVVMSCAQKKKTSQTQLSNSETLSDKYHLAAILDTIWSTEQEPIRKRDEAFHKFGDNSEEYKKYQAIYKRNHIINEEKIAEILKQGWPDLEKIGEQGNLTICNVLQHSSPETRVKYLPLMGQAVKEKQLSPWLLARAEDRIATDRGELQIYGGQIKYYPETKSFDVWPIVDPENVDARRAEIGLEPMAEFLRDRRYPLEWNLENQIKRTKEFKKKKN
ncbi:hypothetical protein GCM10007962_29070 [Yeosuana aromativorans]|uniref:Uncharacterized protein n=1 Tax=Yeosuana aromativorans TaxID=288019 RepID=A0A8J3BME1_9FLAO|nr:DUF6624 domain-containing protein [Yeosuana aromativorans]GGK32946.1 hypothetical protein GCM10007962_29070 [Yeosuana aromativorans]